MRIREITPKIGDMVTLKQPENSHSLPEELADGEQVKLISQEYRTMIVEKDGKQFSISALCVVHEFRYEVGNRWLRNDHPLVIAKKRMEQRRMEWNKKYRRGTSFAE